MTTGSSNVFIGDEAVGGGVQTGEKNIAIGRNSGHDLTSGGNNTLVGFEAGKDVTTAHENTFLGSHAGGSATTGGGNIMIGREAGDGFDAETHNLGVGISALGGAINGGEYNVAIGNYTLDALTSADANTVLGYNAGSSVTTGGSNVLIGYQAGQDSVALTTGTDNVVIGKNARTSANDSTNAIVIGEDIAGGSNDFSFGKSGNVVTNDFDADADWSRSSDVRLKRNIESTTLGLDFINDLRPVKFQWKPSNEVPKIMTSEYNEENQKNLDYTSHGFIAQEVKEAIDKHGDQTFGGWHIDETDNETQRVKKNMFVMPLIKAVQELSAQVTTLQNEVNTLKGE